MLARKEAHVFTLDTEVILAARVNDNDSWVSDANLYVLPFSAKIVHADYEGLSREGTTNNTVQTSTHVCSSGGVTQRMITGD